MLIKKSIGIIAPTLKWVLCLIYILIWFLPEPYKAGVITPNYTWENYGSARLSILLKVSKLVSGQVNI